jgi:hypothetical protein
MRRVLILLAVAALAGCGDDDEPTAVTTTPTETAAATTTSTSTTTATNGIDPLEGASTNPVTAEPKGLDTALHERLAVARHEGYDRVVFQFRNALPGYRVEYVEGPLKEDGSGNPVQIQGNHYVVVRMEPASGFDLNTAEGVIVYTGPRRISGADAGTSVVREVVRTGDFEAVLTWAIGLEDRVDFRVLTLSGPPRLVVDFRNH